jgi:hypothetical protein
MARLFNINSVNKMSNKKSDKEKVLLEKEKAVALVKNLISHCNSILNIKYLKSHEKVAILYKDHVIELIGGEEKFIKYLEYKVPLSKKEYKEIYHSFMDEVKKRKEDFTLKRFDELEHLLGS